MTSVDDALVAASGLPKVEPATAPLTPPTVSLLTAAQIVIEPDDAWTHGIDFKLEGCGDPHVWDPCNVEDNVKCLTQNAGTSLFHPYMIYSTNECNTWGLGRALESQERSNRLTRQLLASESFIIEQELWSNTVGDLNTDFANPKIQSNTADILTSAPTDILVAFAVIEDALGDCSKGGRSMIHMRPYSFTRLVTRSGGAIRREGNYWLTPMDNILVPGRGYNGGAPDGSPATTGDEWIYATGMVSVRRSAILSIDENKETIDRSTNTHIILQERWALASFDPSCCLLAANVTRD